VANIRQIKKSRFHTASVNLRHERFVPTGPLNPKLPPLRTHPQAAGVRHDRTCTLTGLLSAHKRTVLKNDEKLHVLPVKVTTAKLVREGQGKGLG
jgi:hypothetical protein